MENGKKPAFYNPNSYFMQGDDGIGLTKREYFAIHIATGISVRAIAGSHNGIEIMEHEIPLYAVRIADALLKALETKSE